MFRLKELLSSSCLMKYFKFIILSLCLLISACHNQSIQIDWNYGVSYCVDAAYEDSTNIRIYIDPSQDDVIAALHISIQPTSGKLEENNVMGIYNNDISIMKEEKCTYIYSEHEDDGYSELIRLNLYINDNTDLNPIIQYLGLEDELQDGILYYEDELLKSDSFSYQWIINKGTYNNNISFTGESKYNYPQE